MGHTCPARDHSRGSPRAGVWRSTISSQSRRVFLVFDAVVGDLLALAFLLLPSFLHVSWIAHPRPPLVFAFLATGNGPSPTTIPTRRKLALRVFLLAQTRWMFPITTVKMIKPPHELRPDHH